LQKQVRERIFQMMKKNSITTVKSILLIALLSSTQLIYAAPSYIFHELAGNSGRPFDINSSGLVVGDGYVNRFTVHAISWNAGSVIDVGFTDQAIAPPMA
jgi:hypothetical protein